MPSLREDILNACRGLGFAEAGIAPVQGTRWARELADWLGAGRHGQMEYLARNLEHRLDPSGLLPGSRSMILVADQYATRNQPGDPPLQPGRGRLARYARGRDYHDVLKGRLHDLCDWLRARVPDARFRAFTDTAPVLEREHAARAGLGWIAKNTLLINPRLGSYLFLGGILATLDLASDSPTPPPDTTRSRLGASPPDDRPLTTDASPPFPVPDHCGTCTRCIDACPTHAITPYSVDATRCISYLTIEHRTPIDPQFHAAIGNWLYGCDICQEVCPHNSPRPQAAERPDRSGGPGTINPAYAPRRDSFDLLEVLSWTEPDRRAAFTSSAMKRATLAMMKRNALIVAGNLIARGIALPGDALDEIEAPGHENAGRAMTTRHRAEARCHGDAASSLITPLLQRVRYLAADDSEPELVRQTARQVLGRLAPAGAPAAPPPAPGPATTPAAR